MYLEIPKERAATILTQNLSLYEVKDNSDDQIVIKEYVNPFIGMPKYKKRAVIENHNTGKTPK